MGLVEYSTLDDMQKWICRSGYAEVDMQKWICRSGYGTCGILYKSQSIPQA